MQADADSEIKKRKGQLQKSQRIRASLPPPRAFHLGGTQGDLIGHTGQEVRVNSFHGEELPHRGDDRGGRRQAPGVPVGQVHHLLRVGLHQLRGGTEEIRQAS